MQIVVESAFIKKSGAVDSSELVVVGVAAPVRPGDFGQFDVFEPSGVRHVRASAQVDKIAMPVEGQRFAARRDITDDLLFKFVIAAINSLVAGIRFIGFVIAHFTALKGV